MAENHILYRFFAADDRLLYVGITCNPGRRFDRHRSEKEWWSEIDRIELEHYLTRQALREAERQAINGEEPQHNIRMNVVNHQLRRGLKIHEVYALGLDDGECPVGLVVRGDDEGVTLKLLNFLDGEFLDESWVPYELIRRWLRAEPEEDPETGCPWKDSDGRLVFDTRPLGRFQTRWHKQFRRRPEPEPEPEPEPGSAILRPLNLRDCLAADERLELSKVADAPLQILRATDGDTR